MISYRQDTFCFSQISARELLAFSRVQNQVAKSAVLAFRRPAEKATQTWEDNQMQVKVDGVICDEEESAQRGNDEVGYIVINFRNVSDRV